MSFARRLPCASIYNDDQLFLLVPFSFLFFSHKFHFFFFSFLRLFYEFCTGQVDCFHPPPKGKDGGHTTSKSLWPVLPQLCRSTRGARRHARTRTHERTYFYISRKCIYKCKHEAGGKSCRGRLGQQLFCLWMIAHVYFSSVDGDDDRGVTRG